MSWAEIKKFVNSEKTPLNELILKKGNRTAPENMVAYVATVGAKTVTAVNVTGSGRLYYCSLDELFLSNGTTSITVEVDGATLGILKFTGANSYGSPSGSIVIENVKAVHNFGEHAQNNQSGMAVLDGGTHSHAPATGSGGTFICVIDEFVEYKESLKITVKGTSEYCKFHCIYSVDE